MRGVAGAAANVRGGREGDEVDEVPIGDRQSRNLPRTDHLTGLRVADIEALATTAVARLRADTLARASA